MIVPAPANPVSEGVRPFDHVLVTRFNLAVGFGRGQHLDEVWLRERLELFRRYCVPSVAGQSVCHFTWLVLVASATPPFVVDELTEASGAAAQLEIVRDAARSPVETLRATLSEPRFAAPHLITSRLDSDDAIDRTYVERVQGAFSGQPATFVDFSDGYTYSPSSGTLRRYRHPASPFVSLIERRDDTPLTALCVNHVKVKERGPVVKLRGEPGWLQVVHGGNVRNAERGNAVERADEILGDRFGVCARRGGDLDDLDDLAARFGTDKGTRHAGPLAPKGYTRHYAARLDHRRHEPLVVLEIGVARGASLRMWAEYLPHASIFAVEIDLAASRFAGDRTTVFGGDQADPDFLGRVVERIGRPLDLVIDDGGHQMHQHRTSFEVLFPHVAPGGFYAIEDLQTAYEPRYGGGLGAPASTVEYLKSLVDTVNGHGRVEPPASIAAIEFSARLAIVTRGR